MAFDSSDQNQKIIDGVVVLSEFDVDSLPNPPADKVYLYTEDDGEGNTVVKIKNSAGAEQGFASDNLNNEGAQIVLLTKVNVSSVGNVLGLICINADRNGEMVLSKGAAGNTLTIHGGFTASNWPRNSAIRFTDATTTYSGDGTEKMAFGHCTNGNNPTPTVFADANFIESSNDPENLPWSGNTSPPTPLRIVLTGYMSGGSGAENGYNTRLKQQFFSNGDISWYNNAGGVIFTIPGLSGAIQASRTIFSSGELQSAGGMVRCYLSSAGTPTFLLRRSDVNMDWYQELLPVGANYDYRLYGNKAGGGSPGVLRAGMDGGIVLGNVGSIPVADVLRVAYTTEASGTTAALKVDGGIYIAKKAIISSDLEVTDNTKGVILSSPNGSRFRLTVSDAGSLVITEI